MSATLTSRNPEIPQQARQPYRLSVDQYQRMIQAGILGKYDRCELIEGMLVRRPTGRTPAHDGTLQILQRQLMFCLPDCWQARSLLSLVLDTSVPEPDVSLVRGDENKYCTRHPDANDTSLVVEVSDCTLSDDRDRARLFARNNIPAYWIVNLIDGVVEVYTQPSGPSALPAYGSHRDFTRGESVPVVLDGVTLATLAVAELLP